MNSFSPCNVRTQPTEIRDDADAAVDYVPEDGGDEDEEIDDDDEDAGVCQLCCHAYMTSLVRFAHLPSDCFSILCFPGRRR